MIGDTALSGSDRIFPPPTLRLKDRKHGNDHSSQISDGHDMDHYAADVAAVVEHLDLRNAVHIGHSTGGGEPTHYVARHGQSQGCVAKVVLIGAVPPINGEDPGQS